MGYRSKVAYRIAFSNKQVLNEFIALAMMKGELERKALSECEIDVAQDNGVNQYCYVNFFAQDVKWYESYPSVQAHTWLYEFAIERFPNDCAYKFIRLGEDTKDVEEEVNGENDLLFDDLNDDMRLTVDMDLPFSWDFEPVGDNLGLIQEEDTSAKT